MSCRTNPFDRGPAKIITTGVEDRKTKCFTNL